MSDQCRACNGAGGFEGIPASQCPACGKWLPECVDPKWTTRPPNEALDYNPSPNDNETHTDTMPPAWGNLVFDLTSPEGERRLREMLDASRVKLVLWGLQHGDGGIFENMRYAEDHFEDEYADGYIDALQWVIQRIDQLSGDYNIDLED